MRPRSSQAEDADVGRGERTARKVLQELGVHDPSEFAIEDLVYLRGALVHDAPLLGAQGRLTRLGRDATITVSTRITYAPRRRFVIAHELGHLELHPDKNQLDLVVCDESAIDERYDHGQEREANAFASEFLMPSGLWIPRTDVEKPDLDIVSELAKEFEVSFVAAAIRFTKLSRDRCAVVFCIQNRVDWCVLSKDFGHWIEKADPLDRYSLASDYFVKGKADARQQLVSASAWVSGNRVKRDDHLYEHCRAIPSIGATISLLWIPPDAEF